MQTCRIRKDLVEQGYRIPLIPTGWLYQYKEYEYKWEGDNKFFIKDDGRWCEAYSIDFDF